MMLEEAPLEVMLGIDEDQRDEGANSPDVEAEGPR